MRIWHILRTMLELQCDPFIDAMNSDIIERAFQNVVGLDIDPNAIEATKLSLSLFHLVVTGRFPERLNVVSTETFGYYIDHSELGSSFDVEVVNPPFIPIERQPVSMRNSIASFMAGDADGRTDVYLAFLIPFLRSPAV